MIISDSHKLLFVHIQKTGGSTVGRVLRAQVDDARMSKKIYRHATMRRILTAEPELTDYFIFGFVRNPWDRMVSWWSMIHNRNEKAAREGRDVAANWNDFRRGVLEYSTFDQFILQGTRELVRLQRPQIDYLTAGERRADFIGRTENLAEDAGIALAKVGLSAASLGHRNKSNHQHYRTYYNDETRRRVAEVFAKDIAEFDYEF